MPTETGKKTVETAVYEKVSDRIYIAPQSHPGGSGGQVFLRIDDLTQSGDMQTFANVATACGALSKALKQARDDDEWKRDQEARQKAAG